MDVMETVLLILVVLTVIANGVYVFNLIAHDGGSRPGRLPRSHYGDGFEPTRFA